MKYLIKRNDFLRNAKRLDEKSEFLRDAKLSGNELYQELIKEEWDSHNNDGTGSGIMANDIGWHDSLVGRFLNHLVRKAKVAANLVRIKPLIRRLEGEFDRIAAEGTVYKMDAEQKKLYIKSILYSFFWELREAVEKGYEVGIIIGLTETAISNLEAITDEELEERTKELMLKELQLFLEFLKQFDENEGEKDPSISEEDEENEENEEEGSESTGDGILTPNEAEKLAPAFPIMIKNLEALKLIIANYKKVQLNGVNPDGTKKANATRKYITKDGDTIELIQKNTGVNKKNLKSIDILNKNLVVLKNDLAKFKTPDEKIKAPLTAGLELVLEGLFLFEATIGTGAGKDRNKVAGGEDHLTQAYTKLKKDIEVLESAKEKGVGIDFKFLDAIISNSKNTESKNLIKSLYNDINMYLVGDRKATIQEKDPLYKESYEYLMPRTAKNLNGGKIQTVAEKIARFAKRALQFDGENLYGGLGDLSNPLKDFVETVKSLMKYPIVKEEPKKEESNKGEVKEENSKKEDTNEKSLFKYDKFISYIKEADEESQEEDQADEDKTSASDPRSGMSTSEKIQDYFDKKCMTVKEYTVEKTELKKVQENFEKLEKDRDGFIIDGFDPVIDILKLFNRAYKLYMSKHITKRTKGVGVSTSSEYTEFGPGAFRNNKIFDTWESAVLDIMKNRKYQFIFDKKTKLRVGDELRPNGGANLRKFMTDILDGDKLYKEKESGGGQGAQAKLLDSYFGAPDEEGKAAIAKGTAFSNDLEDNSKIENEVNKNKIEIKTTKSSDIKDGGIKSRTFFVVKAKDKDGNEIQRCFFIQGIDNGTVFMQYSKTFAVFKSYLDKIDGGKKSMVQGDFQIHSRDRDQILYTKVRTDDFVKRLLQPNKIEIGSVDKNKKAETEDIEIISSYWITKEDENKKDVIFQIPEESKEQLLSAIDAAGNTKGIMNLISTEIAAKIKPNTK